MSPNSGRSSVEIFMRAVALIVCSVLICSCATPPRQEDEAARIGREAMDWANALERARSVNDNWSAYCATDQVSTTRRCYAGTFGRLMLASGEPVGDKSFPFQVYFLNQAGPYVLVGHHTFPGRTPTVRVDDNIPIEVNDAAGVNALRPHPELVEKLRRGTAVRARFHEWPRGARDIYVDLTGFEEAWQRLLTLKAL